MAHCSKCKMDFCKPSNFRAHVKRNHPDNLETIAPITRNKTGSGHHLCKECAKSFTTFGGLRFHIKQKHPDKLENLSDCQFDVLKHFLKHRSSHNFTKPKKCPLCQYTNACTNMLVNHFKNDHSIEVMNETIELDSVKAFQDWKSRTEAETSASFVKTGGAKKTRKYIKTMYFCRRSGDVVHQGNNIRKPRTSGSVKIGGYCPASLSVYTINEKCTVYFCKTHVGHDQDTRSQKKNIVARIEEKVPPQAILKEIRDPITNGSPKRIRLETRKELHIKNAFNLKGSSARHENDAVTSQQLLSSDNQVPNVLSEDNLVIAINAQNHEDTSALLKSNPSTTEPVTNEQPQVDERRKKLFQSIEEELLHARSILEKIEVAERLL